MAMIEAPQQDPRHAPPQVQPPVPDGQAPPAQQPAAAAPPRPLGTELDDLLRAMKAQQDVHDVQAGLASNKMKSAAEKHSGEAIRKEKNPVKQQQMIAKNEDLQQKADAAAGNYPPDLL